MKKLLAFALLALTTSANAIMIQGIDITPGSILNTGIVYTNVGDTGDAFGVGQILDIRDGDGNITWATGDNGAELNFWFGGLQRIQEDLTAFGTQYGSNGGEYNFFSQDVGTFQATGNFADDMLNIDSGQEAWLTSVGHEVLHPDNNLYTVVGNETLDETANSGNGWIELTGGTAFDFFEKDIFTMIDDSLADMTFNFTADNTSTAGYDYSGSATLAAVVSQNVPEPSSLALLGLGMLGMVGFKRRGKH